MTDNASNTKPKTITSMIKQELYDEVKESRLIILKYKETENQVNQYKMNLNTRAEHINNLQEELKKEKDKNIKLEGDLVEALNNPLASPPPQELLDSSLASQILDDILKLYKDKIFKFDELKIENDKCKKILLNLNVGLSELNWLSLAD
jgi:hypothetical protein